MAGRFWQTADGKRPRPIFKTEEEAKKEVKDFETKERRLGEARLKLSEPERDELIRAFSFLCSPSVTLMEIRLIILGDNHMILHSVGNQFIQFAEHA